jgi:integrase
VDAADEGGSMAKKKRERGNGQGTVAPRRNKTGKTIGFVGAFFGPDGKRRWVSAKTKTECWRKLNAAMADADRGILPGPANLTVERYLTSWLADSVKGTVSRATYDGYERNVRRHIIPELGRRRLKELAPGDIRRLYRKMAEKGLKDRSIEYVHTTLRKGLKAAVVDRLIDHNPTDGVKPIKTPAGAAKESKALATYQVKALLDAASGSRLEAFCVVAIHTGLRRGELLGLRWTDADLGMGALAVRRSLDVDGTFKAPKNRAARRTLKLAPRALEALKTHKVLQNAERLQAGPRWRNHDLVFPNTVGRPANAGNLYRREFQPLLERAGLAAEGFTIHSLRHTFATTLAERGVHPSTAQRMLGHSDIRMTLAVYTHATDGMQDAAADALEEAFS